MGMTLQEAGLEALRDLHYIFTEATQYMNIVTLTPQGEHSGFTTVPGKQYLYMTSAMGEPTLADRTRLAAE